MLKRDLKPTRKEKLTPPPSVEGVEWGGRPTTGNVDRYFQCAGIFLF